MFCRSALSVYIIYSDVGYINWSDFSGTSHNAMEPWVFHITVISGTILAPSRWIGLWKEFAKDLCRLILFYCDDQNFKWIYDYSGIIWKNHFVKVEPNCMEVYASFGLWTEWANELAFDFADCHRILTWMYINASIIWSKTNCIYTV